MYPDIVAVAELKNFIVVEELYIAVEELYSSDLCLFSKKYCLMARGVVMGCA